MDIYTILDYSPPFAVGAMAAASVAHASLIAKKPAGRGSLFRPGMIIVCLLHLLIAGGIYWHLLTHGWLQDLQTYHWDDPSNVNLVLAVFEPVCVLTVAAAFAARTSRMRAFIRGLLIDFLIIQVIVGAVILGLIMVFVLTWHARMM